MRKMQLIVPLRLRKMILTLTLAIASSVWMMKAACLMQAPEAMYQPFETVSGTLTSIGFPCEGEEPCPTCLTIALVTDAKTYYLSTSDAQMQAQLDELEMQLPLRATISGTPFVNGSFDFIKVQSVSVDNSLLPSLCDEWNIAKISNAAGPIETIHTVKAVLDADTIIEAQHYVKLIEDGAYKGALREGESGVIYYIPAGSAHEYLLYNFNAHAGDRLTNLWYGGDPEWCPNGYNATVLSISDETPRVFTIEVEYILSDSEGEHIIPWLVYWTEGIGLSDGPAGQFCPGPNCECSCGQVLLCAYKNGEQVYSSSKSERYGCEFNGIPSTKPYHLCDEWNVLEISNVTCGYCEEYRTYNFHLTTDTVIGGLLYSQLIKDGAYKGALREGNNRDIYCVPAGCSQEYLLYAFNAQVGDSLKNIWVGGYSSWIPDVRSAIVSEIKQTTPRTIELEVHYYEAPDAYEESIRNLTWIEGIGMPFGPMGAECSVFNGCADSKAKLLLCAYKNGEQVYVSDWGEQYGCEYNYNPYETPTDTIPLFSYTGDDPGSSTVDPVDPNQVVATLNGNQLTIHENSGEEINYTLRHNTPAQTPALRMAHKADSFREEVTISITESGEYTLLLTNPSWGYTIYGLFNYTPQSIDQIPVPAEENSEESHRKTRKILINGHILIIRGGKTFTLSGQITDGQPTVNRQSNDSQSLGKAKVKSTK